MNEEKKRVTEFKLNHLVLMQASNDLIPFLKENQGRVLTTGFYFLDTLFKELYPFASDLTGEQYEVFDILAMARETKQWTKYYEV